MIIYKWMTKYNIPRRYKGEGTKGSKNGMYGKQSPNWNGGKRISKGYIQIYLQQHPFKNNHGYVAEHRLVVEESLRKYCPDHPGLININGVRYLKPEWVSHHINGIANDNRPINLSVMPYNSHARFHGQGKRNPFFGKKHSDKSKKKMSESSKGKSKYWLGKHLSDSTKRKLSISAKNRTDISRDSKGRFILKKDK